MNVDLVFLENRKHGFLRCVLEGAITTLASSVPTHLRGYKEEEGFYPYVSLQKWRISIKTDYSNFFFILGVFKGAL